jgi:polar amino acid transport system substrate-binding protein
MRRIALGLLLAAPLVLAACAPTEETASETGPSASASSSVPATGTTSSGGGSCAPGSLPVKTPGQLTIGTDSPAYEPWFVDNDPTNGKGFESAVAYAVADRLGFSHDQVEWVKVPFNNSYAPGEKDFDFDINQISITDAREKVVDFSDGYYSASQAVIALKGSAAAKAKSLDELKKLRLGAQTGTTSLSAITDVIQPDQQPLVFDDTNAAKQALLNDQVDAILADLPTAFYITAVEIPKGTIVGQFQPTTGETEQFGMLFEQGSGLVPCVNRALATLKSDGTLADIENRWLSQVVDVPVLK